MSVSSNEGPRDGLIDFTQYSTSQLGDLQYSIDQKSFPLNYRNLIAELESRAATARDDPAASDRWKVRFTRLSGLLGWFEAWLKRRLLYGDGWLEVGADEIVLHGSQRTWLGVAAQATVAIPRNKIRNVGQADDSIVFERGSWNRRVTLQAESVEQARNIVALLPETQTADFARKWSQLRQFNRSLDAAGTRAWITAAIVLVNVLAFAALTIREKRFAEFDTQQLLDWGGNYGPLTVHGQWWRLLSATFLHLDPLHLIVNMWVLWNVGKLTERLYGRWVFLGLYLSTGILASLTSVVWDPSRVSAGASGAIFGVFGAFLAYLSRRRTQVPVSILRAHWLSTVIFLLFSLVSGALQTGIDNAAHVGGLVTGFALGWVLARPLEVTGRAPLSLRQGLAAVAVIAVAVTGGFLQVRGTGSQLTELERYWSTHEWFRRGEAENLRQWQVLAGRAAAGTISNLDMGYQFENNILPFWIGAEDRMRNDDANAAGEQAKLSQMMEGYAHARVEWVNAIVTANQTRNGKTSEEIQQLADEASKFTARFERISLRENMAHRPRALSNSTVVTYLRNHLFGARQPCVRAPDYFGDRLSATDLKTDGPAEVDAIGCVTQLAFNTDDFPGLERMFREYGKALNDLPDGDSSLNAAMGGLRDLFQFSQRNGLDDLGRTADWRRAYPDSIVPDLVDAELFQAWAWQARGSGTSDTITAQMSYLYNYRTEMAAAALSDIKARADTSPIWYQQSLDVGLDQSIGLEKLRAIFDEGKAKFPTYWPLHRRMLRALLPRWEGTYVETGRFISDMSAKADDQDGNQTYARLWWHYGTMEEDRENVFDVAPVDWTTMKKGFRTLLSRYPKSDYLLNAFANMACQADAATEYEELRPALGKRLSATAWSNKVSVKSCDDKFKEALKADHLIQ